MFKLITELKKKKHNLINHFFFLAALLATVVIWIYDTNKNGNLNMSPAEREIHLATT